jgi:hypothetical protein
MFSTEMEQAPRKGEGVYLIDVERENFYSDNMDWDEFELLRRENLYWIVDLVRWSIGGKDTSVTISLRKRREQDNVIIDES